jgi:hypothetical protein
MYTLAGFIEFFRDFPGFPRLFRRICGKTLAAGGRCLPALGGKNPFVIFAPLCLCDEKHGNGELSGLENFTRQTGKLAVLGGKDTILSAFPDPLAPAAVA